MTAELPHDRADEILATVTAEGEALRSDPRKVQYMDVPTPEFNNAVEIFPQILWMRIPLPIDLNHINVWLIELDDGYIVVDTGMAASMCKEAWAQIERNVLSKKPLRGVFVTHVHPDHIGLAQWLQDRHRIPVWMSQSSLELARTVYVEHAPGVEVIEAFLRTHGVVDVDGMKPMFKPERFGRMTSGLPLVERFIVDGDTLEWGSTGWSALRTDGHAEGHLCLFEPRRNILISGDQVLPSISSNVSVMLQQGDKNPLNTYLLSLERLSQLPNHTVVLPSHGRPFLGLQQRIHDLRGHHEEQLAKLLRTCVQPRTASDVLPILFRRELAGMHFFLALGEAVAHLEYLACAEKLQRVLDDGVMRYVAGDG